MNVWSRGVKPLVASNGKEKATSSANSDIATPLPLAGFRVRGAALVPRQRPRRVEVLYSLRSLAKNAPYIRKIRIFGDRLGFLSDDGTLIMSVPHEDVT